MPVNQLIFSMKAFLFFEAYAPSDLDITLPINHIKLFDNETLTEPLVSIALMKWEIHHGYRLEPRNWMTKSIKELDTMHRN